MNKLLELALKIKASVSGQSSVKDFSQDVDRLAKEVAAADVPTEALAKELDKLSKAANDAKNPNSDLAKALDYTRSKAKNNKTAVEQNAKGLDKLKQSASGATSKFIALAGAYLGINTLKNSLVSLFTTGDKFERLDTQLTAIMGSIEGGEKASAWIKDFAKNTPLQLEEVTQVFVKMKAMGLDPMDGSMQSLVDQTFKMGGGFQELQGISLALGQAWSKQKLQAEEINQLIERGVPVWQLLADATGKNTAELQQLSTAGELGRDTIKALMDEMAAQNQGAAAANMSLLSGLISNARDNLSQFYNMVSQSGALDWLKAQLQYVNDEFSRMANSGELQQWAKRVSDGIINIGEALKSGITNLIAWKDEIFLLGKAWAGLKLLTWVGQLKTLVVQLRATAVSTASAATNVKVFGVSMSSASVAVRTLGAALKGVLVVAAIESIAKIIELGKVTYDLVKAKQALAESEQVAARESAQLTLAYQLLSEQLGINIKDTEHFNQLLNDGTIKFNEAKQAWELASQAMQDLGESHKTSADYLNVVNAATERSQSQHQGLLNQLIKTTQANQALGETFKELGLDLNQLEGRAGESFAGIEKGLQVLQNATGVSSKAIASYLSKAFSQAQNKAELDKVKQALEALQQSGQLSGEALSNAMDSAKQATERLSGAIAKANNNAQASNQDTAQSHQEVGEAAEQASEHVSRGSENATQSVRAQKDAVDFLSLTWEEMGEKVDELQNRIRHNSMRQSRVNENLLDAMAKQQVEYDKQTLAIAGQAKAYRHIEDAINSTEQPSLQFLDRAKKSVAAMDLLDKSKLSALNSQIDSASRKLQNLRDSAKSALASVQDELDQLNGNDEAIAQRRQEQALSQLKEQLEQAELAKDTQAISDLKDAIKLQQQLYKQQQAQAKTEQQTTTQSNDVATTQTTNTTSSVASNSTVKALRLELALPSGGIIQSDVYDAVSQRLLDELEQIKATS